MDLATFLAEKRVLVENRLRAILSAFPASSGILEDAMEYSLFSDGKRIRRSASSSGTRPSSRVFTISSSLRNPSSNFIP